MLGVRTLGRQRIDRINLPPKPPERQPQLPREHFGRIEGSAQTLVDIGPGGEWRVEASLARPLAHTVSGGLLTAPLLRKLLCLVRTLAQEKMIAA